MWDTKVLLMIINCRECNGWVREATHVWSFEGLVGELLNFLWIHRGIMSLLLFSFFFFPFLVLFCLIFVKYLNLVSSLLCNVHVIWTPLHMDKAYLHIIYIESKGVTYWSLCSLSLVCVGVSLNIFVNAFYSVFKYSSFFCDQPTISGEIQSPMGVASVEFIDPREPVAVSYVNGMLFILYTIIVPLFMTLCYQENFRFFIYRKGFRTINLFINSFRFPGCPNLESWYCSCRACFINLTSNKSIPFG